MTQSELLEMVARREMTPEAATRILLDQDAQRRRVRRTGKRKRGGVRGLLDDIADTFNVFDM